MGTLMSLIHLSCRSIFRKSVKTGNEELNGCDIPSGYANDSCNRAITVNFELCHARVVRHVTR